MEAVEYATAVKISAQLEAKREAQKAAMPISERINDRGKLRVWLVHENKFADKWPVDAMELLNRDDATLDRPDASPEPEPAPKIESKTKAVKSDASKPAKE